MPRFESGSGRQCGFCDVGCRGKPALADVDREVRERTTAHERGLIQRCLKARRAHQACTDRANKPRLKKKKEDLERAVERAGLNAIERPLWDVPLIDGHPP